MPVHPFCGQKLDVVRYEKDRRGNGFVYVHHPKAGFLRLPIGWTDRSINPIPSDQLLRIGATGLMNLARACSVALSEEIDEGKFKMNPVTQSNGRNKTSEGLATKSLGKSFGKTETKSSGSVGNTHAQDYSVVGQGDAQ